MVEAFSTVNGELLISLYPSQLSWLSALHLNIGRFGVWDMVHCALGLKEACVNDSIYTRLISIYKRVRVLSLLVLCYRRRTDRLAEFHIAATFKSRLLAPGKGQIKRPSCLSLTRAKARGRSCNLSNLSWRSKMNEWIWNEAQAHSNRSIIQLFFSLYCS